MREILKKFHPDMTLQEAIYESIHHGKQPLKAIAEDLGMTENNLTQIGLEYPNSHLWAKRIPPIIRSSGVYLILDVLEHSVGRVGFTLPTVSERPTADICKLTMKSMSEFGELVKEIEKAINNNKIEQPEKKRILKEGHEAIKSILTLMHACSNNDK